MPYVIQCTTDNFFMSNEGRWIFGLLGEAKLFLSPDDCYLPAGGPYKIVFVDISVPEPPKPDKCKACGQKIQPPTEHSTEDMEGMTEDMEGMKDGVYEDRGNDRWLMMEGLAYYCVPGDPRTAYAPYRRVRRLVRD